MLSYTPVPVGRPEPFVLHTMSQAALGDLMIAENKNVASTAWLTANKAIFVPFRLMRPRTYLGMIWMNGATVAGNCDAGIYDLAGARLASVGTTAQAGTTAPQKKAFGSPLSIGPGVYYLAFVSDTTTNAAYNRCSSSSWVLRGRGVRERATSFVLPADASSWIGTTLAYIPLVGAYEPSWT